MCIPYGTLLTILNIGGHIGCGDDVENLTGLSSRKKSLTVNPAKRSCTAARRRAPRWACAGGARGEASRPRRCGRAATVCGCGVGRAAAACGGGRLRRAGGGVWGRWGIEVDDDRVRVCVKLIWAGLWGEVRKGRNFWPVRGKTGPVRVTRFSCFSFFSPRKKPWSAYHCIDRNYILLEFQRFLGVLSHIMMVISSI
jgi:hypothetical protein